MVVANPRGSQKGVSWVRRGERDPIFPSSKPEADGEQLEISDTYQSGPDMNYETPEEIIGTATYIGRSTHYCCCFFLLFQMILF